MIQEPTIITGGKHNDLRGQISFNNEFDMSSVKRFYRIKHFDTDTIRGWRGHQIEQRWFNVTHGAFRISLVEIENWQQPNPDAAIAHFELKSDQNGVLHVPAGYASSLRALEENSEIIVFADYPIGHSSHDDYLFPSDYFNHQQDL